MDTNREALKNLRHKIFSEAYVFSCPPPQNTPLQEIAWREQRAALLSKIVTQLDAVIAIFPRDFPEPIPKHPQSI